MPHMMHFSESPLHHFSCYLLSFIGILLASLGNWKVTCFSEKTKQNGTSHVNRREQQNQKLCITNNRVQKHCLQPSNTRGKNYKGTSKTRTISTTRPGHAPSWPRQPLSLPHEDVKTAITPDPFPLPPYSFFFFFFLSTSYV